MEPHGVPLRLARAIPVHAEPRQDAVCADARKTPSQGDRGVFANRSRTAETPNLAAQGQVVSRKTVAEVPLTGLSFEGLEDGPVALAAQRRPEKQIAAIWDVFYEIDASIGRGEASVASDFQLHQRIVEATCNPSFDDFMKFLGPVVIPRQTVHVQLRAAHGQV
ncbi:MAG: FCD domain-containing protein [Planctomycetaceae bacterium]|jgi:hypothetical protein|nr:FCD domain-containing protein [Planctomycetaceae bacterium]